jgi:hypothetical protein
MSGWYEATGGLWIVAGAGQLWSDRRQLAALAARPSADSESSRTRRQQRLKAVASLGLALWWVVGGVAWITGSVSNPVFGALAGCFLVALVSRDVRAWRRSRHRRAARLAGGAHPANPG